MEPKKYPNGRDHGNWRDTPRPYTKIALAVAAMKAEPNLGMTKLARSLGVTRQLVSLARDKYLPDYEFLPRPEPKIKIPKQRKRTAPKPGSRVESLEK
jgi:hypothetical protein